MILIISIDNDTMTDEICSWLSFQNKNFVRLNKNQHVTSLFFDFKNSLYKISINYTEYNLNQFKSVFYRNGGIYYNFNFDEIDDDLTKFYNSEFKSITEFIYYYLETSGANIFGNLFTKEVNKLEVLLLAKSLGLKIPHTYILSQLQDISKIDFSQEYINKAISELKPIFVENELYLNYTREICIHDFKEKKENIIPSLIQEKVHKIYEIRIFFFIKKIWAIATFDFSNNIDIRNVKDCEKKYLPYKLPIEIEKKIHKMAHKLRLKCGTIDLIQSHNQYYFLEVNPLGQFSQVSYYGNYQIEKYIADLL